MAKPFGSDTREASCTQSCAGAGPSFAHLELFCAWRAQSYGVSFLVERRGAAFQKVPNRGWPKLWSQSKPFTRIENHSRFEHPPNTTRSGDVCLYSRGTAQLEELRQASSRASSVPIRSTRRFGRRLGHDWLQDLAAGSDTRRSSVSVVMIHIYAYIHICMYK